MRFHIQVLNSVSQIVSKYHVGFRIHPADAPCVSGQKVNLTGRLELTGHHDFPRSGNRTCADCIHVLEGLFDVVDLLRAVEEETVKRAGGTCNLRAHYASTGRPGHEVKLEIEMALECPVGTVAGNWIWIFLERARTRLMELGCRASSPADAACDTSHLDTRGQDRNEYVAASAA